MFHTSSSFAVMRPNARRIAGGHLYGAAYSRCSMTPTVALEAREASPPRDCGLKRRSALSLYRHFLREIDFIYCSTRARSLRSYHSFERRRRAGSAASLK